MGHFNGKIGNAHAPCHVTGGRGHPKPQLESARYTLTASHLVDDDIDTCTMEEARNLNFCRTGGGGASELQQKNSVNAEAGRNFFSVDLA